MNILRIKTASVDWRRYRNLLLIGGAITLSACAQTRVQFLVEEGQSEALLGMDAQSERDLPGASRRGKNFCAAGRAKDEISVVVPGVGAENVPASNFSPIRVSPSFDNPLKFRVNAYDQQGVSCIMVATYRSAEAIAPGLEVGIRNAAAEFGGVVSDETCSVIRGNPEQSLPDDVFHTIYFDYGSQPNETSRNARFEFIPANGSSLVTLFGVQAWDNRGDATGFDVLAVAPDSLLCEAR